MGDTGSKIKEGFEDVGGAIKSTAEKAVKGVKKTAKVVAKGVKRGAGVVGKGLKKAGEKIKEGAEWQIARSKKSIGGGWDSLAKTASKVGDALEAPSKWIKDKTKAIEIGGINPLGVVLDSTVLMPSNFVGKVVKLADKKRRDKLLGGDIGTIVDYGLTPLDFVGAGGASKAISGKLGKSSAKAIAKKEAKDLLKSTAKEYGKKALTGR